VRVRARWVAVVSAALVATTLAACGDGGLSLPSGTATITGPNGTATLSVPGGGSSTVQPTEPAPTETAPPTTVPTTATPTPATPTTATPTPVTPTTATPTPATPTTATPTPATPTQTVTATTTATPEPSSAAPSDSPSGEAAGPTAGGEEGISPWWWVILGLLVLGGTIWFLLAHSARRRREEAELLAGIEQRGRWAVDHGVGELIGAGDPGATQQAWSRLDATLVDLSAGVRTLAHQTPADRGAAVFALRDAVASLQGAAQAHARARLVGDPSPATAAALFDSRDRLARALASVHTPTA
jgi:hypothetical protein